jgi:uncharacterized protein YjbJ (UPF0337 family)
MSATTDKIKGYANEAGGKAKQAAGDVLDKPDLVIEGELQEAKGKAQQAVGEGKEALKKAIDRIG